MTTRVESEQRMPLSRERVLRQAITLADSSGLDALTMRNLAQELGVEAMSIYYHIENKEALLDGVVDMLVAEINRELATGVMPDPAENWKSAMRARILTARHVMLRHKWAPEVIESRTNMSPAIIKYHDDLLGIFVAGGFSYDLAHHAMHALGSRSLGFTQELFKPDTSEQDEESSAMLAEMADEFPHITAMLSEISHDDPETTLGWCDDQTEFEFGIDLLLEGLERLRG